ncbi:MAG: M55 family metallopeptidase [Lachnospiraceae bacterium]|jgi:D-amino peptidase|nr:M55 family metallopeptidase [Lachnospiraceae bacterium]
MKVFISADIEGISTTCKWEETEKGHPSYPLHATRMTDEVLAVIRGAKSAGATQITVRDAHDSATNIDPLRMPDGVRLIRNWSGHPYSMVDGIDSDYDAVLFVGYHSAASVVGNAMSHTMNTRNTMVRINGRLASEFMIHCYAAALEGVPSVFLAGDKALCESEKELSPYLVTVAEKEGRDELTICYPPAEVLESLKAGAQKALNQDLKSALIKLPESFKLEISYKDHNKAYKASFYPGVRRVNSTSVVFENENYFEILRTISFIL